MGSSSEHPVQAAYLAISKQRGEARVSYGDNYKFTFYQNLDFSAKQFIFEFYFLTSASTNISNTMCVQDKAGDWNFIFKDGPVFSLAAVALTVLALLG
ncbi:MAG: hypothetical protein EZS28_021110 [Streblomastix strix]|uniref:Uncharacterized protein n=1 Tax=Streblomastix strix TaxID=222440 RepID=A0A5J4VM65_9EUKA|nr:MAG: hypothetical protein EZS28_021110 [Streblomastix strix]